MKWRSEPCLSVLRPDVWKMVCDGLFEGLCRSGFGCAEQLFELGPGFLDGIEIGRVGWQIEQFGSGSFDAFAHAGHFVRAEVVHDHHIARSQHWAENMFEISEENFSVRGRFDRHGGDHATQTHRTQARQDFPVSLGRALVDPNPALSPGVAPGHLRRDTAFVQENQPFRRDRPKPVEEDFTPLAVFFRVSLGGVERLFFSRKPNSRTTRHICVWLTAMPVVRSNSSHNWRRTRSGLAFNKARTRPRSTRLARPCRLCGARSTAPLRLCAADTFHAQGKLTPNRSASSPNVPLPPA